jgi:hypothetical protein
LRRIQTKLTADRTCAGESNADATRESTRRHGMSPRSIGLSDQLYAYLIANAVREAEPLRRLREETAKLEQAQMQVAPEQGQLLAWLRRS